MEVHRINLGRDSDYWNYKMEQIGGSDELTGYEIMDEFVAYFDVIDISKNFTGKYIFMDNRMGEERLVAHFKNGDLNDYGDEPAIKFESMMSDIIHINFKNGYIHNRNAPAITADFNDCSVEHWFIDGMRHRDEYKNSELQPAFKIYNYTKGKSDVNEYYINGEIVRELNYLNYGKLALQATEKQFPDMDVEGIIYEYSNLPESRLRKINKEIKEVIDFYKNTNEYKLSIIQNLKL